MNDVLDVEKRKLVFPIETTRRNPRVSEPVERDVVEHVVSCKLILGLSWRGPMQRRGDRRRRLGITVTVADKPGCQADGRIRNSVERLRARRHLVMLEVRILLVQPLPRAQVFSKIFTHIFLPEKHNAMSLRDLHW
jgi:hypothetical protein